MQKFTGVDVTDLLKNEIAGEWLKGSGVWYTTRGVFCTWDRPAMGLTGSPYQAVQTATRAKRLILGDRRDQNNLFRWDSIIINAPGDKDYNPTLPWIFKRRDDGNIGGDLHTYIDDNRVTANNKKEAWAALSQIAKVCSWLGMQDAARKRREPSNSPGAWAGTIIRTEGEKVEKLVSQERWDKTREKIRWMHSHLVEREEHGSLDMWIPFKMLESIREFLVYVSRTYTEMVPYLKGIHLTLDSWRGGRARSGWKIDVDEQTGVGEADDEEGCSLTNAVDERIMPKELRVLDGAKDPPKFVRAATRLSQDVGALMTLTSPLHPPAPPRSWCVQQAL